MLTPFPQSRHSTSLQRLCPLLSPFSDSGGICEGGVSLTDFPSEGRSAGDAAASPDMTGL